MAVRPARWRAVLGGLAAGAGLVGCGKSGGPGQGANPADAPAVVAAPTATPVQFDQPFDVATTTQDPGGTNPPPATTLAGKSTAQLHLAVRQAWPAVKLTDAAGKPSPIAVTLDTDAGPVEVTLFPDVAPNHVRNFLALAAVGYYDGLVFERIIRQELVAEGGQPQRVEVITAGCPTGEGEGTSGHLGYFLRSEGNGLTHEAGTVGFVRGEEPNSACCRVYICLTAAPVLDGHFTPVGKVTAGLDVVRGIAARPVKNPAGYPECEQPREPVKIKSVTRR